MDIFQTKIDDNLRVLISIYYSFFIAFQNQIDLLYFVAIIFTLFFVEFELKTILKRILKVNIFILFTSFTIAIFHNSIEFATLIFLRANLIAIFTILLFNQFDSFRLYLALKPILPNRLSLTLFFSVKYIEILQRESLKLKESLKLRNFQPKVNIFTFKTYAYLFGTLIIKSFDRIEKFEETLKLRCHKLSIKSHLNLNFKSVDYLFIVVIFSTTILGFIF